jgi:LCP family protein required for cell wall assembly
VDNQPVRRRRRHKVLIAVGVAVALLVVAGLGALWYTNHTLGSIDRFTSALEPDDRATKATEGPAAEAINILLLGVDKGNGESIESELSDGEWTRGAFRSDTMMLLHVPADRESAYLVSIPRDSYVEIPDHGRQKINAAFSLGGPDLAIRTVERLTDVYIDHVAMVDWAGFKRLTEVVGGVEVTIPETFTDASQDRTWEAGTYTLEGEDALAYVRTRYGLEGGDLGRIKRQQNFLRATLEKTLSQGTLANPIKLRGLLGAVADNMTVDSNFTPDLMRRLARDLRSAGSDDVVYLTVPVRGLHDVDGVGSVVLLDEERGRALWRAVAEDDVDAYLDTHATDQLGRPQTVD